MSDAGDGGARRREVAYRLFATEFDDADLSYSEGDEERAPNYVVTPTGARVNRLFVVGVLTEVEAVSEDVTRARIVDPTGAFVVYAGQYQPDEQAFLERAEPPTFVAVTGKARTFQPEDSEQVYTSVRPESLNAVDAETRDRWTLQAAAHTIERVRTMAAARDRPERGDDLRTLLEANDVEPGLAAGIPLALDHYETGPAYLSALYDCAVQAAELVAGDRDEVEALTVQPDAAEPADLGRLPLPVFEAPTSPSPAPAEPEGADEATASVSAESEPAAEQSEPAPAASPADEVAATDDATAAPGTEAAEPAGEPAPDEPPVATEEPGDSQATGADGTAAEEQPAEGLEDFESEFDLDDDERAAVESEYGTEFTPGSEVDEPGETDIETPEPVTEEASPTDDSESDDAVTDSAAEAVEAPAAEAPADEPDEGALEDVVVAVMADLDEGAGADRQAVIDAATDRAGASPAAIEDAIQSALMNGRCYEPDDETLQPI